MADTTFLDELARLNAQNFLGGFAEMGQAVAEKRKGDALHNLYNRFSLERNELMTTDERLSEFNKELTQVSDGELNGGKVGETLEAITNATLNFNKILKQTNAYENLYRPYITAFATLGDEGVRIANTLSRELESKKEILEKQGEIPLRNLEYQNALLNRAKNRIQLETGTIQLDELKSDVEAKNMLYDMMDTDLGRQVFTFNVKTGRTNLDLNKMYNNFRSIYGDNPAFGKAWLLLEQHYYDNLQRFTPPDPDTLSSWTNIGEKINNISTTYSTLSGLTKKRGQILYDREEPNSYTNGQFTPGKKTKTSNAWIRQAYSDAAAMLGKEVIPEEIGSDLEIIDNVENKEARDQLRWIYDHFYDSTHKEYYGKYMKVLREQLRNPITGEIPPISIDKPDLMVEGLPVKIDISRILTDSGGEDYKDPWYSYDPYAMPEHATEVQARMAKEIARKKKEEEKGEQLQKEINILNPPHL